jgi:hypothetical protein
VRPPAPTAASPLTWLLGVVFLIAIGALITRTPPLWGKSETWIKAGIERAYVWQSYAVARKLFHPRRSAAVRIEILGNSRVWMPARDVTLERALHERAPQLDVRVDNLAIFGARIGDFEIISRYLADVHPSLVIVTLNGADLVPTTWGELINPSGELLDVGWRDGPLPPPSVAARVDRWARTVWPLYRLRRFVRERIVDALSFTKPDSALPDRFTSLQEYFDFFGGPRRGKRMLAAYEAWRREPTLANFVTYLGGGTRKFGLTEPVPPPDTLTMSSPGVVVLDRLLARLGAEPFPTIVLLMPENPLLDEDVDGTYHRPGFSDHAAEIIRQVADRHGVRVVDGRRWMSADRFADIVHLFPDISGFQDLLADEILHVFGS